MSRSRNCKCLLASCRHCKKHHKLNQDGTYGGCTLCPCEVFM